jgi:DNA repair protein RadA/Sms
MSKAKQSFICASCNYNSPKWIGCCPECQSWSSFAEQDVKNFIKYNHHKKVELKSLSDQITVPERLKSNVLEWDRVLGGGIVPGSLTILTGDPGVGKSTLLLQIANTLSKFYNIVYVSSEESLDQIQIRAQRIGCVENNLKFLDNSDLNTILGTIKNSDINVIILDSIQNCCLENGNFGSAAQLRDVTFELMKFAKEENKAIIATGHVTKDGIIAGPRTIEHLVDTVLYLQTDDKNQTRILRSVKNRFGSVNEIGFFEMNCDGLKEVRNYSQQLVADASNAVGSILVSSFEGSRPIIVELQALIIPSSFGMPQRVITGIEHKQVILIAAILEKYLHVKFSANDIFFKVSGGIKLKEQTTDLAIALSLLSSYFQKPLSPKSLALGEISLTGQIKPISQAQAHVKEGRIFGIEKFFLANTQKIEEPKKDCYFFSSVYELLRLFPE